MKLSRSSLALLALGVLVGGVTVFAVWSPTAFEKRGASAEGVVKGKVSIGPLCPVEPCPDSQRDVYSSREVVLQPRSGSVTRIRLRSDGGFESKVALGAYTVSLTDCFFLGCSRALPRVVTVEADKVTQLDISIDTGIR